MPGRLCVISKKPIKKGKILYLNQEQDQRFTIKRKSTLILIRSEGLKCKSDLQWPL